MSFVYHHSPISLLVLIVLNLIVRLQNQVSRQCFNQNSHLQEAQLRVFRLYAIIRACPGYMLVT